VVRCGTFELASWKSRLCTAAFTDGKKRGKAIETPKGKNIPQFSAGV